MKQKEYPVHKGQVIDVDITGYTSEGQGVARVEGLAVFVAGASTGGSDILVRLLKRRWRTVPIGQIAMKFDATNRLYGCCACYWS